MYFQFKYKNPVLVVLLVIVFITLENVQSSTFSIGDPLAGKSPANGSSQYIDITKVTYWSFHEKKSDKIRLNAAHNECCSHHDPRQRTNIEWYR